MGTQKDFNRQLAATSRLALAVLIPAIGLKRQDEQILWLWFVEQRSANEIAEELHIVRETAFNSLCRAKKRMRTMLMEQGNFLSPEVQGQIKFLLR